MNYNSSKHPKYLCLYHVILVCKYRKKLLTNCSNKTITIDLRCTNSGVFSKVPAMYYMNSKFYNTHKIGQIPIYYCQK